MRRPCRRPLGLAIAAALSAFLTISRADAAQLGSGSTLCDETFAGAVVTFDPNDSTLGAVLQRIRMSTNVIFIADPAALGLPVFLPTLSLPWASTVRSLLHINELAGVCRQSGVVEIVPLGKLRPVTLVKHPGPRPGSLSGSTGWVVADGGSSAQFAGTIGAGLSDRFAVEFEVGTQPGLKDKAFRSRTFDTDVDGLRVTARSHADAITFLGVVRAEFPLATHTFRPYVSMGSGVSRVKVRVDLTADPFSGRTAEIRLDSGGDLQSFLGVAVRPAGGLLWPVSAHATLSTEVAYGRVFAKAHDFWFSTVSAKYRLVF